MIRVLIAYSTTDGHTVKICHEIKRVLERLGHVVTLSDIGKTDQIELPNFDKIVIGASIRYGRHSPLVYEFIERHLSLVILKSLAAAMEKLLPEASGDVLDLDGP